MEAQLEKIRDQQKESWNRFSPGWKKWDATTMEFLRPVGDKIVESLHIKGNERVLDIAAGTGEPGLTIATMLPSGKVVSTDLSEGMLEVARENATRRGIKNFETRVCDVCELPFEDNSFDAVSCRFGFMFFPDMALAAREMVRVLKPGGRLATSVWNGPEKNFWVTAISSVINKNMELAPPPPGAPGMFRCAQSGLIRELFKGAGLQNTTEIEVQTILNCGTTDVYWNWTIDISAPFVAVLSKADDATKEKIKREVLNRSTKNSPPEKCRSTPAPW